MITGADQEAELGVQVPIRLAHRALVVHRLLFPAVLAGELEEKRLRRTKYSVVLPDASLTPPLKTVEDVL